MRNIHLVAPSLLSILVLPFLLAFAPIALAQDEAPVYEYLVVSYGETFFSNPLLGTDSESAAFSKVLLFSDIGVTIPNEAIGLQRNIDILGRFGWELVTVLGAIGGDQQLVFKRPYDEQRSIEEAERIRAEREQLIEAYNSTRHANTSGSQEEASPLVDVDAVEFAQATQTRNERDANLVREIIEAAAEGGFSLADLTVTGEAYSPEAAPRVDVRVTQDVTAIALIAPGQYRKSLVDDTVSQFTSALTNAGLVERDAFCGYRRTPAGEAAVTVTAVINHNDDTIEVGTYRKEFCFRSKGELTGDSETLVAHDALPVLISGEVTSDITNEFGDYAFRYRLSGVPAGEHVRVSVQSEDFDTYLYLLDEQANVLDSNDDAGAETNSALTFTSSGRDTFIEVTSFGGTSTGSFTLSVVQGSIEDLPAIDLTGVDPTPLEVPGTVEAELTEQDRLPNGGIGIYYALEGLSEGELVDIVLTSDAFDTYLRIVNPEAGVILAENDDNPDTSRSAIEFLPIGGLLWVQVTSWSEAATGAYTLRVTGTGHTVETTVAEPSAEGGEGKPQDDGAPAR